MSSENQTQINTPRLPPNSDPTSIYYIHPSENSITSLSSIRFNGSGYADWKRSVMIALSARNKIGFVTGKYPEPSIDSDEHSAWQRCNDLIISWLLYSLDEHIAKSVLYFTTAREIWTDLEDRFGYTSGAQLYALEQQLYALSQGSSSVSEFYTRIKVVWDELNAAFPLPVCTCNKCTCNLTQRIYKAQQDQRLIQFLMKVNDEFANVRSNIIMQQPLPLVAQAYRLLAQEERHKEITSHAASQPEPMAFSAQKPQYNKPNKTSGNQSQNRSYYQSHSNNQSNSNRSNWELRGQLLHTFVNIVRSLDTAWRDASNCMVILQGSKDSKTKG